MTTRITRFVLLAGVLAAAAALVFAGPEAVRRAPAALQLRATSATPTIGQAKGAQRLDLIGKQVTLEGFYCDDSIPMLVDNTDRLLYNLPLPDDSYVLLSGAPPSNVKRGDRVQLQGTLKQPGGQDAKLQTELALLERTAASQVRVVTAAPPVTAEEPVLRLDTPLRIPGVTLAPVGQKYAVLLCGGYNYASTRLRYWNEIKWLYQTLRAYGYSDANIFVIWCNGFGVEPSVHVDYPAAMGAISAVFNTLAGKMNSASSLFVATTGPAGGYLTVPTPPYPAGRHFAPVDADGDEAHDPTHTDETLALWGGFITDDQFKAEVGKIHNYSRMTFAIQQCFGAGWCRDLQGPRRIIETASGEWELSRVRSPYFFMDEFFLHLINGLRHAAGCDTSGDGKISMTEAYNYARTRDMLAETQWYEDNGAHPASSGGIPGAGEGALGTGTYL